MNSCSDSSNDSMDAKPDLHMNLSKQEPQERYVWEMRTRSPNVTPASTVLNSPDLNTELPYAPLHHHHHQPASFLAASYGPGQPTTGYYQRPHHPHHQIRVGRSPGSQFEPHEMLPQGLASPGSPTDVGKGDGQCLRDGEIVVFDDIDTNWMNKSAARVDSSIVGTESNEDVLKVTKMIGQLPIAEYEGSPRRFGNQQQQQLKGFPKRPPGFPQRVSPTTGSVSNKQRGSNNNNNTSANMVDHNKSSVGNLIDLIDHEDAGSATASKTPTFDYLYEFSETRKVLEEFFKANPDDEKRFTDYTTESGDDVASLDTQQDFEATRVCDENKHIEQAYIGQRLARIPKDELYMVHRSPKKQSGTTTEGPSQPGIGGGGGGSSENNAYHEHNDIELYIDSNSRSSGDLADTELEANLRRHSRNFTLSPETTDYDSNCGDLDSLSNDINCTTDYGKLYTSMPVLEDGLSSGHASDTENNVSVVCDKLQPQQPPVMEHNGNSSSEQLATRSENDYNASLNSAVEQHITPVGVALISDFVASVVVSTTPPPPPPPTSASSPQPQQQPTTIELSSSPSASHYGAVYAAAAAAAATASKPSPPPPPAPAPHRPAVSGQPAIATQQQQQRTAETVEIQEAMKEIRSALQRAKTQPEKLKFCDEVLPADPDSPVWVPRAATAVTSAVSRLDEEEADTDLETDRLLGQQRHDEQDLFCEQSSALAADNNANGLADSNGSGSGSGNNSDNNSNPKPQSYSTATIRQGIGTSLTPNSPDICQIVGTADVSLTSPEKLQYAKSPSGSIKSLKDSSLSDKKAKSRNKEGLLEPKVLIEGVLFRARYLGSTQLVCEGQPTKSTRMMQAEEAVSRIKAPEGESQPSTEVDLFISTEKIMVLNTDLKEIMMDHALRTISYIADIGDLVVLMARRRFVPQSASSGAGVDTMTGESVDSEINGGSKECNKENGSSKHNRTPKMICHVFESDEAQFIAQSIGQAFQVAYMEFLKANGIENENLAKEMDYQEVLNSQEIFGDELEIFAKKELQKEVVVPKAKGEILGVVIVESGWGSMLPTVVIANLMSGGAAARCGQLNIGDQLIAINGMSLVGLPLSTCQSYIRNAKNQTAVKFTVVPCPPVVEVKILRPKALFQLGFSVQNGVICSLLRGGIAERGGVRVGHRIIEINNQSVVAVPHDTIVKLLSSSVGEILMKTMPTSMFRLLTGQETPIYI
ncbi:uncharacterized protein LOC115628723 isoform X2 [Scaptodrosophila lebanonensis]|uniref:Uncharacterized protein LOC115628723 isoform X2 n=1 Tax=Drosophila lebanonensis TaxID=7225 RepID=A0A6J2TW53_DROLE|nr:uncharacterized protein LOC115628723 isoform X2 [Scaptodrosophila lebanonensis]